jgi:Outer membrane protein beta-barrel domain
MMRRLSIAALGAFLCTCAAAPASAQVQWTDKGFVNVNFGAQAPSQTLDTDQNPDIYGEPASIRTTQDVAGGGFFDISAGYKVWKNLAAGVGFTHVGSTADLSVSADIPDPNFFDRPRAVSSTVSGAGHSQNAIHLTGTWMMPMTEKVDFGFQFGPTIFLVSQELPGIPTITEPGPTVNFGSLEKEDKSTVGIHFGVDGTYLVTPRFGVGALLRYSWGSVDFDGASDGLTVGGFQIGVGGRVRF